MGETPDTDDQPSNGQIAEISPAPKARARHSPELYVALGAFLLSLGIVFISIVGALRGAAVSALPPDRILVYRNGQQPDSLLAVAVRIPLINTSNNYNDILTGGHITIGASGHTFELSGTVGPVHLSRGNTEDFCGRRDLNCVYLVRMAISDLPDDSIIIPAGGAHARYYSFELLCPAGVSACGPYQGFQNTLSALGTGRLDLVINLSLYADGDRTIRCKIGPLDRQWILDRGWQTMLCTEAVVSGNPIF